MMAVPQPFCAAVVNWPLALGNLVLRRHPFDAGEAARPALAALQITVDAIVVGHVGRGPKTAVPVCRVGQQFDAVVGRGQRTRFRALPRWRPAA